MGLQRHIKVLGIFSRLAFRDSKPQYLLDLPRVLAYTREALDLYRGTDEEVATFREIFEAQIVPACQRADWFASETSS